MTEKDLNFFKNWFSDYVSSFYSPDLADQKNMATKVQHTYNVCSNINHIARELTLSDDGIMLAEAIALFHDIGRFPQYAKYKTFKDSISVNHGLLGAETLIEKKILKDLPEDEQGLIIRTVKFHNAFTIADSQEQKIVLFLKLIRDADKLDILRVFVEYYKTHEDDRASAIAHGLPDTPEYSKEVLLSLYNKRIASYSNLKTLNDFKLMNLSWIYDLNFKGSFRLLVEKDYINKIIQELPQTDEIKKAAGFIREDIYQRLEEDYNG